MALIAEAHAQTDRDVTVALAGHRPRQARDDRSPRSARSTSRLATRRRRSHPLRSEPLDGRAKGDPRDPRPRSRPNGAHAGVPHARRRPAAAALAIFDRLLNTQPGDLQSWRGRSRSLVRLAEAYERVGDSLNERRALGDALRADPSLGDDPLFQIWYKRLGVMDAHAAEVIADKNKIEKDNYNNPRTYKKFGIGFDLCSASGLFTVNATLVVKRVLFPRFSVDFGPGPRRESSSRRCRRGGACTSRSADIIGEEAGYRLRQQQHDHTGDANKPERHDQRRRRVRLVASRAARSTSAAQGSPPSSGSRCSSTTTA
jgi:hypothetical protein